MYSVVGTILRALVLVLQVHHKPEHNIIFFSFPNMTENLLTQLFNCFLTLLFCGHDDLLDHVNFAKDIGDLTIID